MPMPSQIDIRIQSDIRVKFDQMVYECDGNGIGGICTVCVQDWQWSMPQRHNQRQPSQHGQPSPDRVHSAQWQSHFNHSRIPHLPLLMYLASRQSQLVFRFCHGRSPTLQSQNQYPIERILRFQSDDHLITPFRMLAKIADFHVFSVRLSLNMHR